MKSNTGWQNWLIITSNFALACSSTAAFAAGPASPKELAEEYIAAFNNKDVIALTKLKYPLTVKSPAQDFIDSIQNAELQSGTRYSKFDLLPVSEKDCKPSLGPDGAFYQPNLKPTNLVKLTSQTKDASSSVIFPIGEKAGVYYLVSIEPAPAAAPPYQFGWQRCSIPRANWSVLLPNEAEPGKAALELQFGNDVQQNPDVYGVVKNTGNIKTVQHYLTSGAEGKRLQAQDNTDIYRIACTTFTPDTLKQYFSDPKKNLSDTITMIVSSHSGKLVEQKDVEINGSPGSKFEIEGADGSTIQGRVYWIKDALYELSLESKGKKPDAEVTDKFLGSLEVN